MIRNSKKIFLIIIFLFFIGGFVFAQSEKKIKIFVAPVLFEPQLNKGDIYKDKILVRNKNEFEVPVEIIVKDFDAAGEYGGVSFKKGESADWFKIKNKNFTLKAWESKWIPFQIKIPENTPRGGYYSALTFRIKTKGEKNSTIVFSDVSSLFLISVGKKGRANFKIIETKVPNEARCVFLEKFLNFFNKDRKLTIAKSARIPFTLRVKNNDIYHIKPIGTLELLKGKKSLGKVVVNKNKKAVLPGKVRQISVEFEPSLYTRLNKSLPDPVARFFSENFYFGKYKVISSLQSGEVKEKKETEVYIFPLVGIFTMLLFFGFLSFIIVKYKRNQKITKSKIKDLKSKRKNSKRIKKLKLTNKNKVKKIKRRKAKSKKENSKRERRFKT